MESRDGRLEVGDELVNVNGANMRGLTTDQVRPVFFEILNLSQSVLFIIRQNL